MHFDYEYALNDTIWSVYAEVDYDKRLEIFEVGNDATSRSDRQRFRRQVKAQPLKADPTEGGCGFRCCRVILKPPVRPSSDRCFHTGLGERPGHEVAVSLTADNFRSIQPQQMIR